MWDNNSHQFKLDEVGKLVTRARHSNIEGPQHSRPNSRIRLTFEHVDPAPLELLNHIRVKVGQLRE